MPLHPASRLCCLLALCLSLFLSAFSTRAAQAQSNAEATATASLTDPAVDAGDTTQYRVTVDNGNADRPPNPPVVDGLTISYAGPSQQYSINVINGNFTRRVTVTYTYVVQTTRPGRFTIPGPDVSVKGAALHTQPVTLTVEDVGAPAATPPGQMVSSELLITKKTAYVGESFSAELRAYFGLNVNVLATAEEPIFSGAGFSAQKFTKPRVAQAVVDGVRYRAVVYRTTVTGVKTGPLSVGPVDTMPTVQMQSTQSRRHRRGNGGGGIFGGGDDDDFPFGSLFGGGGMRMQPPQQIKVTAPPVKVEILPLPPGQPPGFSGGIGQFKLEAEAEPRRAQTGDPVTVRLILTGQGNFPRVNAPVLTDERGLRTYPATSQFKADDDVGLNGTKTFEQVVIADGPRTSLPAYHFDYLDPATGKYVALDTAPIPVEIAGSAAPATPAVSTAPAAADTPTATPTPTPRAAQDILYIRNDPGRPEPRDAFLPVYRTRDFWLAQAVPLAALLLAAGWLGWRRRARNETARRLAALHRQQGELQRVLRRETTSRRDFYTAATRLAQLRAAGGRADDQLSAAEIVRARALDPQTAGSVQHIFGRHEELAYSGGQTAQEPVPADERRTVLATLETLGKNGR